MNHTEAARELVTAEIEDVLAGTTDTSEAYKIALGQCMPEVGHVLIETAAIAGEAVIRLAAARGEDPRATWHWLLTTEWTA